MDDDTRSRLQRGLENLARIRRELDYHRNVLSAAEYGLSDLIATQFDDEDEFCIHQIGGWAYRVMKGSQAVADILQAQAAQCEEFIPPEPGKAPPPSNNTDEGLH